MTSTSDARVADPAEATALQPRRRRRRSRKLSKKARYSYLASVGLLVALVACIGWLVHLSRSAASQLGGVRTDVATLRSEATTLTPERAALLETDMQVRAAAVEHDTHNPVWRLASHIPDFGSDFTVAAGMAHVTDELAQNVLPPLVSASRGLSPDSMRRADGNINLATVAKIGTATSSALPAIAAAQKQLQGLNQHVHVNALASTREALESQLAAVHTTLGVANTALSLTPAMLGADGPRHYFVVFQNLAEARGTGGYMGTWGELTADNGTLTLTRTGPDSELTSAGMVPATVEPGDGYDDTWGQFSPLSAYGVANLSPNFPDAGQLFAQHASAQLGVSFDGVLALDPVALGSLLGPRHLTLSDGTVVTGSTVAAVTESTLYVKYGEASPERKQLLAELAKDAFDAVKTDSASVLLRALRGSIGAGHLQLWSAHPAEQAQLAATDLGGVLPTTPGPFAYLAVNNTGPKTDFWLQRSLTYTTGVCPAAGAADQTRDSSIDVTLTDRVPPGQAAVVAHDENDPTAPYGRGHDYVSVYAPVGALFASATLDGQPAAVNTSTERGHLVMSVDLLEPDGVPQKLSFHFTEPATGQLVTMRPQPMGQPETVTENVSPC